MTGNEMIENHSSRYVSAFCENGNGNGHDVNRCWQDSGGSNGNSNEHRAHGTNWVEYGFFPIEVPLGRELVKYGVRKFRQNEEEAVSFRDASILNRLIWNQRTFVDFALMTDIAYVNICEISEDVMQNIEELCSRAYRMHKPPRIVINYIINQGNYTNIQRIAERVRKEGVDEIRFEANFTGRKMKELKGQIIERMREARFYDDGLFKVVAVCAE